MTRDKEDLEQRYAQLQTNHTALQENMRHTQEDMRHMQAHIDDVSMQNNRLLAQVQSHRQSSPTPVQYKESWEISHKDIVVTEEKLGHGGWGEVYVGTYFKQRVAVKKLHNNIEEHFTSTMVEEINTMSKLRHPNLLQFIGAVIDGPSQSGSKMLVTEIMDMSLRAAYKDKILIRMGIFTSTGLLGFGMLSHHRVLTSHLPTIPLEGGCYCTFGTTSYLTSHLIPHVHSTTSVHAPHVTFNDFLSIIYSLIINSHLFYCYYYYFFVLATTLVVVVHQYSMVIQFLFMYMPSSVLYCKVLNNNNNNNKNRILLEQWMKEGVMEKFDWMPHFKYVVQTLEGKAENEAKEREKELQQKLKNIISCNIKQDPHITSEYLGPYNILICALVLNITSTSVVDYEAQMKKLSSLVKRGGHVLFAASTLVDDSLDYRYDRYQFPGSDDSFTGITLSMRTLVKIMEKFGLKIISSSNHFYDTDRVWTFVAAIKA